MDTASDMDNLLSDSAHFAASDLFYNEDYKKIMQKTQISLENESDYIV